MMKVGTQVRLKSSVDHTCPEGRENNLIGTIQSVYGEHLDQCNIVPELQGCSFWNKADLEMVPPSINRVIENPELLNHDNCWSFYDWFCTDSGLINRANTLIAKVKFLVKEGLIDGDTCYVWFKNNCPMHGSLYDDIRISRRADGQFLGGICPKSGFVTETRKSYVWFLDKDLNMTEQKYLSWKELKSHLKSNEDLRKTMKNHFK